MKKNLIRLSIVTIAFCFFRITSTSAQIGIYYEEDDYCGFYTGGACTAIVTKSRVRGGDYCAVHEQIPCEEKCPRYNFQEG